ncbi:MAG: mandelate racemase/muconate lactonizing enzyme family protein [Betaproteobacteria bacterium]|nr:mandelate racemase/muconate lactonizing enzyme family protein [Betaproteobacteria bacterium]
MSRIRSVSVCLARVPLASVTSFATRTVSARDYCLVRVRSAEGVEGIGFCYAGSSAGNVVRAAVEELLAPRLVGQESLRVEGLWQELYQEALLHGRAGSVMRALSILDIALWDLNARAARLPLYQYLGCCVLDAVPAYASGGYYLARKTPKKLGEEMAGYVKAGFTAVKMKVGRLSPAEEEVRVRAAREAVGPDIHLMLDANNAWSDLPTAVAYMERFERYAPYWIEEPFGPDDIDNHAKLAQRTRVAVATGEIACGRWYHKELLEKRGAEVLQTDAAVCGGITEWRRIAATAASYGVTLSPHWFHDLHAHLVAATPNARYVEFFPDDQVLNFRRLIDAQLTAKGGKLLLPKTPGLGFKFDEKAVRKYALTPAKPWAMITSP